MKQIGKKYNRQEALRRSVASSEEESEHKEADPQGLAHHHIISESKNSPMSLFNFVQSNPNDPAKKVYFLNCF